MEAVEKDADWETKAITTGDTVETVKARYLNKMAEAAWVCGDPYPVPRQHQPLAHLGQHRAHQCQQPPSEYVPGRLGLQPRRP